MASEPKRTTYAIAADNGAWLLIPCTMLMVRIMEIEEIPPVSGAGEGAFTPQGLQYQVWDPSLVATPGAVAGGWGPTQLFAAISGKVLTLGSGFTVLGSQAQPKNWAGTRAADNPVQILSGTATATQIQVREYTRKIGSVSS